MRKRFLLFLSLFAATTVSAQLSGTYIINSDSSQNPDFVSFSEAASALSAGVSGQVVFEVAPGTFMEYVNIGEINGTSAENKVVFKGMGADNQQVTITSNAGYTANSTLTLSGTDFVTFENMTLSSTSEHTAHVVKLLGGNEGVRFQNVRFVGCVSTTSNTDNEKNLVYRLSGNWVDNDNAFVGCEFVNGFIGLYYQGYNINQYNNGVLVEDCHFSNQCSKAIYTTFTDHVILRGNTVVNKNDGSERVIDADGVFIAVGITPRSGFVGTGIETNAGGYIVAGETCETSIPGVFAAGDVRAKQLRQVVTAVADGANAVTSVQRYLLES